MTRTLRTAAVPVALLVTALVAAGCASSGGGPAPTGPDTSRGDINATPRERLADGGTLTWPLGGLPETYNANHADGGSVQTRVAIGSMFPPLFVSDAGGNPTANKDYLESAELTSTDPQVVIYRINPAAAWYDGTPITYTDFQAQWQAMNGTNEAFQVLFTTGYQEVGKVEKGADEREVVVTFTQRYAAWRNLFNPLYPATTNQDPTVFNEGWAERPLTTAGPFKLDGIDQTAKTVTLVRNERWWGRPAKLDKIVYRVVDADAQPDALANGEIDIMDVGPDVNKLTRAQGVQGVTVHRGGVYAYTHLTLNGASPLFADVRVRKAFAMAIDRTKIVEALLGPLGVPPVPLNNHVYMSDHRAYKDNSGETGRYQPERAKALLEEAGWKPGGATRVKDGKELVIRLVILAGRAADKQVAELVQGMAAEGGFNVRIEAIPQKDYIRGILQPGNFDIAQFSFFGQGSPIAFSRLVFSAPKQKPDGTQEVGLNYSRGGSAELDDLFTRATQELDPTKEEQMGNQIDAMLWELALNIPLFQRPDIVATKSTLANYGAFGYANLIYEDIGFTK